MLLYCAQDNMKTQLELARAVFRWLVRNITFPADDMWGQSVTAPLLPGQDEIEEKLCMSSTGTWSERAALLFVSLAKACHLEAVTVSGFWRHEGCVLFRSALPWHARNEWRTSQPLVLCWKEVPKQVAEAECIPLQLNCSVLVESCAEYYSSLGSFWVQQFPETTWEEAKHGGRLQHEAYRLQPGMDLIAHNHCWNAIKVDGLWRLVDCADGARLQGHTRSFFTAPDHFRTVYQPLNAPWSLLRDYISDKAFFSQMWASVRFFKSHCRVLEPVPGTAVVNLPAPMEGLPLPVQFLTLAIAPGYTYAIFVPWDTVRTG